VKAITRDARLVPGAGATEMQLVERIQAFGEKTPGLPQYSIKKYGEAFEVIPRTLAESAGLDATEVLSRLYTAHHKKDDWTTGVDIEVWLSPVLYNTALLTDIYRTTMAPVSLMLKMKAFSIS
jgi:T-complex protein 1 subunit theta